MSIRSEYSAYLANQPITPNFDLSVEDKFRQSVATRVPLADAALMERAIAAADGAAQAMAEMPSFRRQAILNHCVQRFEQRSEELAVALCVEAGKPIGDSRGEVTRLIDTFRVAAEESTRMLGEVMPLDISPRAEGYRGMWKRVPIGPCAFITPFNFPLNLVAHKVAPALAVGCPFVLKPASKTPIGALLVGEILAETDLPEGAFSILPASRDAANLLVTDDRLKKLSFTGSQDVGWGLKAKAGKKKVTLELGGNAACIVDEGTNLEDAVQRIVFGAFYQSGQSCVSVQRILIHRSIYDATVKLLCERIAKLKVGDPMDKETFVGPIISHSDAERIENWIESARKAGAKVLVGGKRDGILVEPTLLADVPKDENVCAKEVFGPVAVVAPFDTFDQALAMANDSDFGLQVGIFTRDIQKIMKAWDTMEVGGVIIGDVPSWRVDHMPYGGVKESGIGREGVRFAMNDMTEIRNLVIRSVPD
ncbi:aldehyde dehydrogenase [Blastopirellula marina]|uniref:Aldehyde dehydrogenase n=1 Tax=Blastopirellula marina TaxID=124 RepID=A0A2S8EYS1_9BACT|nr:MULTISPECIES: aldehyde dehydrogenase family protein [Pirellulaceae]PQO25069.1 aldehyde dehydrogenase [Blastopirellula marina]RCS40921.1 aldehyde dehydrogenase family protein [Bremerella cremea]